MERRVTVEGCLNFRDLGGYPTADGGTLRWRQLFRADGLHALSPRGVATLRDEIALGDIIDLRSSAELALDGRGLLEREPIRFHHLPLFDGGRAQRNPTADIASLADLYFGMIDFAREPIAKVITVLARTRDPAVFHCAAGKDRTGVISALVLSLLDVRDEVIVADYAATREALDAIVERLMSSEGYQGMFEELPPDTLHANPETMEAFLARVRAEFGGMADYAREIGVDGADVERLRARMVAR
ncbi:MAG: tyrosine-protein phosphatase [Deltaproteobacteria bacterium]|nr:MAG: tyrosine-protein phosphatase [Deltaproteobacteria bacterium]